MVFLYEYVWVILLLGGFRGIGLFLLFVLGYNNENCKY